MMGWLKEWHEKNAFYAALDGYEYNYGEGAKTCEEEEEYFEPLSGFSDRDRQEHFRLLDIDKLVYDASVRKERAVQKEAKEYVDMKCGYVLCSICSGKCEAYFAALKKYEEDHPEETRAAIMEKYDKEHKND